MNTRLFTDDEWHRRMNNHEVLFLEQGKKLVDLSSYVFKLENKVKILEKRQKVYEEALMRLATELKVR